MCDEPQKPTPEDNREQAKTEVRILTESLLKESDRAIGVFGGELVSQRLAAVLRSYCRQDPTSIRRFVDPLFTGFGPLATFAARIQIAYAFGIICERDRIEFDLIRKIRNEFAHSTEPIDFGNANMVQRLDSLAGASESQYDAAEEHKLIGQMLMTRRQFVDRLAFAMVITAAVARLDVCREVIEAGGDVRQCNTLADPQGTADGAV